MIEALEDLSGLKMSSLDSVVYELVEALILSKISSLVLGASRDIGVALFILGNR